MLHRISSICFMLAIITYLLKYIKVLRLDKKFLLKSHIFIGSVSIISMIMYSILDFIKEKDVLILMFIPTMIFIGISGDKKIRTRYKYLHILSVVMFCITLIINIIL